MTPSQINAAIAVWRGWTKVRLSECDEAYGGGRDIHLGIPPGCTDEPTEIPNYHGDLNACHDAIKKLDEDQFEKFIDNLQDAIGTMRNVFMATPPQRAEALLRTIGKWKE